MADNRQFTDHNEIGGINVYLEDKKLAESPTQAEMASTDYVVLKDTDGVPHKISRANMVEVIRDCLGDVLANNDKGSAINKVLGLGTSDNDLGTTGISDLASVLGEPIGVKHYEYNNVAPGATIDIPKSKCCIAILWERYLGNDASLVYCGHYAELTTLAGSNWVSAFELSCGTDYIRLKNTNPTAIGWFYITVIY